MCAVVWFSLVSKTWECDLLWCYCVCVLTASSLNIVLMCIVMASMLVLSCWLPRNTLGTYSPTCSTSGLPRRDDLIMNSELWPYPSFSFQHPNILEMYGCFSDEDRHIAVYPFLSNGSLHDKLHSQVQWIIAMYCSVTHDLFPNRRLEVKSSTCYVMQEVPCDLVWWMLQWI